MPACSRVAAQGRHRYFRLAGGDIAQLLEALMGVAFRTGALRLLPGPREPALRKARVCYDHLAGELGVRRLRRPDRPRPARRRGRQPVSHQRRRRLAGDVRDRSGACRAPAPHFLPAVPRLGRASPPPRRRARRRALARFYELRWAQRAEDSRVVVFTPAAEQSFAIGVRWLSRSAPVPLTRA